MTDTQNIGLVLLAILVLFPTGIAAAWGAYQCWGIYKSKRESKKRDCLIMPMIEDYLTIMNKLDNISQYHELETVAFCLKIFKDAYSDLADFNNYFEEMNQMYKVKEIEILDKQIDMVLGK